MKNKETSEKLNATEIAATTFSDISISGTFYNHDRYATPRGHGFAAEDANHLYDFLHGKKAQLVGSDNAKNGADRIVDGQYIQTKFCSTGSKCIAEAFENGKMKYIDSSGNPMQIEVPKDNYDGAIKAMESRIKNGQVPGIKDPVEAKNIVRKSPYTYEQVKNIAKAGNIDSLKFDSLNGAVVSVSAFGVSSIMSFAGSVWSGEALDVSLQKAAASGFKVGGVSFASSLISSQLSKAGLNRALISSSDTIVNILGPKASAVLVNSLRSGGNIYGAAAMKSASKLLRGNIITSVVTGVILETVDFVNIFQGRISGKQLVKNIARTAAGVAGGAAGWTAGVASAGAAGAAIGSILPGLGTVIGGSVGVFIGGIAGAMGGGAAATAIVNTSIGAFVEDDANEMVQIIEQRFSILASNYLLSKKEADNVVIVMQSKLSGSALKDMYASSEYETFADNLISPLIEKEVSNRSKIKTPTQEEMLAGMRDLLENFGNKSGGKENNEISAVYNTLNKAIYLTNDLDLLGNEIEIERYLSLGSYSKDELANLYALIDIKTKDFSIFINENEAKITAFELASEGDTKKSDLKILKPKTQWYDKFDKENKVFLGTESSEKDARGYYLSKMLNVIENRKKSLLLK